MNADLIRRVWERAGDRCEYCQLPSAFHPAPFQIDHIIARQHGGKTEFENLALACIHCNRFKGPNVAGLDAAAVTTLWNANADTLASINFGNGYFGLYYESEGRSYIAIPDREQRAGSL